MSAKSAVNGERAPGPSKCLTLENVNPALKVMEYAVRGPLLLRALQLEKELEQGVKKPFKEVTKANVGDCHAMKQAPITFIREVLALVTLPKLLDDPSYSEDVKQRARAILKGCPGGSVGSYTDIPGIEIIRRHCAEFIERRDGVPANWENVITCAGASDGIVMMLKLFIGNVDNKPPGILIPIPQYPLYSALLTQFSITPIHYYLNEEKNWSLDIPELERAITEARKYCSPKAIVVINPGNPTGQVLTRENIEMIIKFAYKEHLVILADEVYQENVYADESKFFSFKKVLTEMGEPYSKMELASFNSASKGYMGECGIRGGYTEVINLDPGVRGVLFNSISCVHQTNLGQTAMDCVVNPPKEGEPSFRLFKEERDTILASLKERAKLVADGLNKIQGISCQPVQGAMYAFPKLELPAKAIAKAASQGQCPSVFYALQVLENTGICIVPGDGFGQKPGTYHFRITILQKPDKLKQMLIQLNDFHQKFLDAFK